ncbi:hypothetical protein L7F22_004577 [Adiantum nelumboides]|nr:hypothetical protein [Adiantum nelumboides]
MLKNVKSFASCLLGGYARSHTRPEPANLHEVRSFLGLCSYYRKFIRFFAEIAAPLHDLTRKGVVFRFGERQQQAFKLLKEKLTTELVLILPDLRKSFQVQCDACGNNIGAILMQDGHVIAYESRVLRGPEKHMQIYEELLAVIHALESWKHYLLGADFTVQAVTDLDTPSRKSSTKHQRYPLQDSSQFTRKRRHWHGGVPCPDDWPQRLALPKGCFFLY